MSKRAPRNGSRAWEDALYQDPVFIKNMIERLTKLAAGGDAAAARSLEHWLSRHPEYRPVVPQLCDLMEKVESIWIRMIAGTDKAVEQGTTDEVAKVKAELLDSVERGGGILEKLMASSIAVNYLVQQHAAATLAQKTEHHSVVSLREHRMTAAQKRLHASLKQWARITEKKAKGMTPPATVGFFAEETAAPKPETEASPNRPKPQPEASSDRPSPNPLRRPRSASQKLPKR